MGLLQDIGPLIKQMQHKVVDIVLPPQELLGVMGDDLARRMWADVSFLDAPWCEACGFPFEHVMPEHSLCLRCEASRPAYDHLRAPLAYDAGSRALILSFKHGGRTEGLKSFAAQMRRAGRDVLDGADLLVPVPLHPRRLMRRRYNQAALLARALSKITEAQFDPDILVRQRPTQSQGRLNARARALNVRGAFALRQRGLRQGGLRQGGLWRGGASVHGLHIVLIDDVMTTGATLEACARTLKRAGAARVDGLCLARVVKAAKFAS